ncbi:MAG: hypothetical protein NTY64_08315 [Deltaproteobacteria bacterium]|nr:hypothetical protein [Deltaproteobacteria bacterium]
MAPVISASWTRPVFRSWPKGNDGYLPEEAGRFRPRVPRAIFTDGVAQAAKKLGKGTEEFALHSKGLEVSLSNTTTTVSLALSWATSNRGACHLEGFSRSRAGCPLRKWGMKGA